MSVMTFPVALHGRTCRSYCAGQTFELGEYPSRVIFPVHFAHLFAGLNYDRISVFLYRLLCTFESAQYSFELRDTFRFCSNMAMVSCEIHGFLGTGRLAKVASAEMETIFFSDCHCASESSGLELSGSSSVSRAKRLDTSI